MSFHCGLCKRVTNPGDSAYHVVVATRWAIFPKRIDAHHYIDRDGREILKDDPGGAGWQIVHEVLACKSCKLGVKNVGNKNAAM